MRQQVGAGATTVAQLLLSVAPPRVRRAAAEIDRLELALMEPEGAADESVQMAYATALCEYADAGGYDIEVVWDSCCTTALGVPFDRAKYRSLDTLSGGEQKRLVLEYLLAGPDEVLLLDEPDNYLDVPGKRWLEERIGGSAKTVLFVSHDRELLANTATRIVTVELGAAGNTAWTHPGGFSTYHEARRERFARFEELTRRWDEEHAKLRAQMLMYKQRRRTTPRWPRAIARRRRDCASSRRSGRRPGSRANSRCRCACGAAVPASGRWCARRWGSPG
jgi:ATPase subunit of ABC transporter with duplicated ATPase domains